MLLNSTYNLECGLKLWFIEIVMMPVLEPKTAPSLLGAKISNDVSLHSVEQCGRKWKLIEIISFELVKVICSAF